MAWYCEALGFVGEQSIIGLRQQVDQGFQLAILSQTWRGDKCASQATSRDNSNKETRERQRCRFGKR